MAALSELCSPRVYTYDRFIPRRPHLDVEVAHARLMSPLTAARECPSPWRDERLMTYGNVLEEILDSPGEKRVLPFWQQCRSPETQSPSNLTSDGLFSCHRQTRRRISSSPKKILDMPKIRNDFYTNVLDWGHSNKIAVALEQSTYIWDIESKMCQKINFCAEEEAASPYFVSAVCWDNEGHLVTTGDSNGQLEVSDLTTEKVIRRMQGDSKTTVSVIRWRTNEIYTGNRNGGVCVYDMRCPNSCGRWLGQGQDICGMAMSQNSHDMATGGNGGVVRFWDLRAHDCFRTIKAHSACSKAIAWCPWRSSVIATGGGAQDGYIRLWQVHTGEMIAEISTKSQICGLLWSQEYQELASSHGAVTPENNDIVLWKMSRFQFEPQTRLQQHLARPLHMALSPDETTIASAGVDEMMCIWDCFPENQENLRRPSFSSLALDHMIR
uniref:Cell division cycle protein 20 homolog n=1 Tax=Crassostrea virginica TaxID=6565 RepID=A0A8B8CTY0_CRAVI|nr:cell division cycle protein 20 homolog [Crassostrea virginica]